jgi:hypothetical protein
MARSFGANSYLRRNEIKTAIYSNIRLGGLYAVSNNSIVKIIIKPTLASVSQLYRRLYWLLLLYETGTLNK